MHISHLELANFRNYRRLVLDLPSSPILLRGGNAQGKTNLLEAIYYLATTRSPHAGADRQLINWQAVEEEPLPFARIAAAVSKNGKEIRLDITLIRGETSELHKEIRINRVKKRALDILGQLTVVLFLPENIELVTGGPAGRRRYLDITLCQIDREYCTALARYQKLLAQRNALLKLLRERGGDRAQLDYWDDSLAADGALIMLRRQEALMALDGVAGARQRNLSAGSENLQLFYAPSFDFYGRPAPDYQARLTSDHLDQPPLTPPAARQLAMLFGEQLKKARREEIARGMTIIGPHRDDWHFLVEGIDMTLFGSRGQQRTAALALKLAEVEWIKISTGEMPVLLLDDVMSELDSQRRLQVLELVNDSTQSILTTTDWDDFTLAYRQRAHLWNVEGGIITESEAAFS